VAAPAPRLLYHLPDATAELERAAADIPLNRDARDVLTRATALASDRGALQAGAGGGSS